MQYGNLSIQPRNCIDQLEKFALRMLRDNKLMEAEKLIAKGILIVNRDKQCNVIKSDEDEQIDDKFNNILLR